MPLFESTVMEAQQDDQTKNANRTSNEVMKEDKRTKQTTMTPIGPSRHRHRNEYATRRQYLFEVELSAV